MISFTQLTYIVAVDSYRHFVTASEKCYVTQPTLSMQIKKLEKNLGITIFDRTKQPIVPTEIGMVVIEQARKILAESNKIAELIKSHNNSFSGELTIGIIPSLAPYLVPLFISGFVKKYPEVKLRVIELLTDEIVDQLKKELIDVGLIITPLNENGIIEKPLFYEEMLLFINKKHPFAKADNIEPGQLASPDLWLLNKGHCFRSQVINLCDYDYSKNENHKFEYESGSLETIKNLVIKEGGFTLVPQLAIENNRSPNTIVKKIDGRPLREVSLVSSRNYVKKRLLGLLSDEIIASIPGKLLDKERGKVVHWR